MGKIISGITKNKIVFTGIWAVCINFIVECLSRRGLWVGVVHMVTAPYIFLLNTMIIAFTLSFVWLFAKRKFMFVFISFLWILAGVVDFILLSFRKTPFTANDFMLVSDALKIINNYINMAGIILLVAALIAAVLGIAYYWKKSEKTSDKIQYLKVIVGIVLVWLLLNGMIVLGMRFNMLSAHFGNITTAFEEFGFAYGFSNSIFDNGIDEPKNYDSETFLEIYELLPEPQTKAPVLDDEAEGVEENPYPNIIFLQLESFMNPYLIKDVEFSENPVPNFQKLYEEYPSGYLMVPSFGAGTANTEFEVLTGMNLDDFGTGEYPYKTVLKDQACETICYNLRPLGYVSHGLHNNDGSFYNRYRVFANLGFDTYTSIEYMEECEMNPVGWAKDTELTKYVMEILDSTKEQDFIYGISVQGHGDYPQSYEELEEITLESPMEYDIKVSNYFDENTAGFEYYLNQVKEMDDFVGELIAELSKRDEKTILVFYGDHLPGFSFTDELLESGDIYKSQYVIWSNFDYGFEDEDLESYQLSAHILKKLGAKNGIINRYHQNYKGTEQYLSRLTMLEYDILYGEQKVYDNKEDMYVPTQLKMGIYDITITQAYNYNERICVEGTNFNKYSYVVINGKEYETECINPHTLVVKDVRLENGDVIEVVQHGEDGLVLSTTSEFIYHFE